MIVITDERLSDLIDFEDRASNVAHGSNKERYADVAQALRELQLLRAKSAADQEFLANSARVRGIALRGWQRSKMALAKIACGPRQDGTWKLDRKACMELACETLDYKEPTP